MISCKGPQGLNDSWGFCRLREPPFLDPEEEALVVADVGASVVRVHVSSVAARTSGGL